ncbi:hypothetical protein BKA65DRAFT_84507 [Rhexocercosporidium sp. MPI-PUGE-AT-0058]|nr:hypothetical protein BKA65DRAFT_84507 [Rhexocercosporidium sp. MPI-PUGE-AT-0058]
MGFTLLHFGAMVFMAYLHHSLFACFLCVFCFSWERRTGLGLVWVGRRNQRLKRLKRTTLGEIIFHDHHQGKSNSVPSAGNVFSACERARERELVSLCISLSTSYRSLQQLASKRSLLPLCFFCMVFELGAWVCGSEAYLLWLKLDLWVGG